MSKQAGHDKVIPDNGCIGATEFLGAQSHCLECPFPECDGNTNRYLRKRWRNNDIERCLKLNYSVGAVALRFGLSTRTVQRVEKEILNA